MHIFRFPPRDGAAAVFQGNTSCNRRLLPGTRVRDLTEIKQRMIHRHPGRFFFAARYSALTGIKTQMIRLHKIRSTHSPTIRRKQRMKKIVPALALAATLAPACALAEAGDWVVRLRGTHVAPDEGSDLGSRTDQAYGAGTSALVYGSAGANLQVDDNTIPELDISYYFTRNIAAELILAVGTRHDVKVSGNGGVLADRSLGSVNLLPPTLTLQWHFLPDETFDPYIGAGVSYVLALDRKLEAAVGALELPIRVDRSSWGPALQAGFDVNLRDGWLVNFDVKKIWFETDVKLDAGAAGLPGGFRKIDSLDVDPWVISIGLGRKF